MQIFGILAFVVALLLSVMIHEFGHYLTAKRYGMKVSEFFLGFGTRIFSMQRGETEFGIKAIPAGGYCKIEGMTPGDVMPVGEENRAFYKASSGRKLIVLGAGSFLHFVIGYLLLFTLFAGIGTTQALPIIAEVINRLISSLLPANAHCQIAECSESTGIIWFSRALEITNSPPATRDSLLARANVFPASRAARVGPSPIEPVMAVLSMDQGRPVRPI